MLTEERKESFKKAFKNQTINNKLYLLERDSKEKISNRDNQNGMNVYLTKVKLDKKLEEKKKQSL